MATSRRPLTLIDNIAQVIPAGDTLESNLVPVSAFAGNKILALTDGLYSGNNINEANAFYVSSVSGNDNNNGWEKNSPKKTIASVLAQIDELLPKLQTTPNFKVLLKANESFVLNGSYDFEYDLTFGFYDSIYGDYNDKFGTTSAHLVRDVDRPSLVLETIEGSAPYNLAGFNAGKFSFYGINIEMPNKSYALDDYGLTGAFRFNCQVKLNGCNVNLRNKWGLISVIPNYTSSLTCYGTTITVNGVSIDTPDLTDSNDRSSFIRFYLAPATNRENVYLLNPSALTSSNGSGMLVLNWIDSESFEIQNSKVSVESYPKQLPTILGLRNYITGIIRSSNIPLNVITPKEL